MGILITYSSYFPKDTKLTRTAITVSLLDLLVAILMGVIIFPTVLSYGLADHNLAGGTLVFVTLPEVFAHMPCTQLWSILFFLLLMVAALTSTISIAEVSVAFVQDRFNKSRLTACLIVLLPLFVLSAICSLSNGSLSHITIFGNNIFDALDYFATNMLLPIVSIFTCIYIGWFAPKGLLKSQLTNDGELKSRILPIVLFIIRYIAPLLIFFILISKII
jgi:NSS family neurotransmitter:Na+ symporter